MGMLPPLPNGLWQLSGNSVWKSGQWVNNWSAIWKVSDSWNTQLVCEDTNRDTETHFVVFENCLRTGETLKHQHRGTKVCGLWTICCSRNGAIALHLPSIHCLCLCYVLHANGLSTSCLLALVSNAVLWLQRDFNFTKHCEHQGKGIFSAAG